ncbi:bacillithiol biosynthesis deacetylase BshB2 [Paenibacillus sp. MER 180]|uniref:bacillithiol biosynthesis deacetylase BshB2 n=1 Tax=unclassified Paenibacillus TaxID=185978 RepID=UPI0008064E09|nr:MULTISPECIES: bacillithiol biosynthesis deacetylase BshB2 [unclassified Paenibacillus]MCM3290369.1 bacillithiol biosynthesis deacetylase BshB2 [Paenibacillus sp. MER 180]OBY78481.1 bacillithiol biosynthesis deacetylase BshB2 [Paenibacillus sp. KS1]
MESQQRIVVVLPHPDDEGIMAGTLARHIHQGMTVTYACLTLGEMGRNMGNPLFANRVTLPLIRKQELLEACKRIGIEDVRMWGYHDKTIEFEKQEKLARRVADLLVELKPAIVYTFYPGHSVHPDHDATGAAVVQAVKLLPESERPTVLCIAFSSNRKAVLGEPGVVNDVSDFVEQKIYAIHAHQSQVRFLLDHGTLDDPAFRAKYSKEVFWEYRFVD